MRTEWITYERPTRVPDLANGSTEGPAEQFRYLAEVKPFTSKLTIEGEQATIRQGYKVTHWKEARFTPGVGDRVIVRGKTLSVQAVIDADTQETRWQVTGLESAPQNG